MLIVEGPDGGGKTTLVNLLANLLEWRVNPRVVNKDTTITEGTSLMQWVDTNLDNGFQQLIFDRHRLISEPIYGPLFRGGLQDGFDNVAWFSSRWDRFIHIRPLVIYCLPPLEVVTKNVIRDPDNKEVSPLIAQIYWQYWTMANRCSPMAIIYDYTHPDNWSEVQLKSFIQRHVRRVM